MLISAHWIPFVKGFLCSWGGQMLISAHWGQFADGHFLSQEQFVSSVRSALQAAGVEALDYAGHSFRIGAATTAALSGVQDSLIKTLGRWESSAYMLYIRTPREALCAVSRSLVRGVV